jgi:hypothetical protein
MPMSPEIDKRIPAALLILRFFLALFLLQWSVEKLILPDSAARIARSFYGRRDDFPIHDAALLRINGHQSNGVFQGGGHLPHCVDATDLCLGIGGARHRSEPG